uniref:Uncharacterized protein n=1 Tax=Romanomermis culicivorax TaxID=13658 RepID=A0A915J278_ROMCU
FSTFNSLSWTTDDDETLQKSGQETLNRFLTIFKQTIFYNDDICM